MEKKEHLARPAREGPDLGNARGDGQSEPASTTVSQASATLPPVPGPRPKTMSGLEGERLGSYEILRLLGKGGIGLVYLAYDHRLTRQVALKLLRTDDPEAAERLLGEARAQARVGHENVCRVFEAGEIDGQTYIAMRYIEGRRLTDAFRDMTLDEKVEVIQRVAEGLDAAHELKLIHRDVKPGNILVERTPRGEWKPYILDFGLAREQAAPGETTTGEVKGTPSYMPPEQVTGQVHSLDARADVYSLGATFYEGLAGRPLFPDSGGGLAVMLKVLNEDPEPLRSIDKTIPADLESIVMRCLEKDPDQRYASARELADDLQRFLDGEPILARPIGSLTRLWRRLRKRRVAALAVALVATVLLSAGSFVLSWLHAREKTRLMEQYRQDVRYVDGFIGHVYRAPLHDVTAEKAEVRERLAVIRARLESQGRIARGPASYALGRGHLALHEYEEAHHHLEVAWREGTRDPEVGYALGRTLGALYEKELRAARDIQDEAQRAARQREIEGAYRQPALDYLRRSGDVEAESVELVEALIAFWEERYDEALEKAAAAYRRLPWLYEALTLEADVHVAVGAAHNRRGDYHEALAAYRRAQEVYAAAAEKGRSDARIYERQCNLGAALMELEIYGLHGSLEPHFEYGLAACSRARQVDPERVEPYHLESILYWRIGEREIYKGVDPTVHLQSADAAASKALETAPESIEIHASQGWARALLAYWQAGHGRDPRPLANRALEAFGRAVEIDPRFAEAYSGLGYTRYQLARWQIDHGLDPSATLAAALEALERAVAIEPDYLYAHDSLGNAYLNRADWELRRGEDPRTSVEEAVQVFARMMEINPNYVWAYIYTGDAWSAAARHQLSQGQDPATSLESARAAYDRALAIDEAEAQIGLGRLATLEALAAIQRGGDPRQSFGRARQHLERGIEHVGADYAAYLLMIELDRFEAEWKVARGLSPAAEVDHGLAMVDKALAFDPGMAELKALGGTLRVLRAEAETDPRRRRRYLDAGRGALEQALAANVHLSHWYQPVLDRAGGKK